MKPYHSDELITIYHADCRDVLPTLEPVDACVTDPPYGLGFMGKEWDHAVPDASYWRLVMDALKPGAPLLAFGGTRLWHWLAVGIESAGFEIRDTLMYLYGSGFPKSLSLSKAIDKAAGVGFMRPDGRGGYNVTKHQLTRRGDSTDAAKQWDGWGTALKPAWEPVIQAMKPLDGTFAENALEHGVAGLHIDGARIPGGERPLLEQRGESAGTQHATYGKRYEGSRAVGTTDQGRWPANLALDEEAARLLDEMSGERAAGAFPGRSDTSSRMDGFGYTGGRAGDRLATDSGGASRFFYTAKASPSDRGEGNTHPTVKPTALMYWLLKLVATPTGGTVLDPFMGSGTTLYCAKELGRRAVGIDTDERSCEIAAERCSQGVLFGYPTVPHTVPENQGVDS